jgi:phage shock protein E
MKYVFILMLFFAGFARAQQPANPDGPVGLDAKSFRDRSATEPNAVILDVRTPEEVREGIVPGAKTLDFHASDFAARIGKLDKNKTYFVYCKAGGRSSRTVDLMKSSGFKHVHELEGGYLEWTRAGYPVKKP